MEIGGGAGSGHSGGAVSVLTGYGSKTSSGSVTVRTMNSGNNGVSGRLSFSSGTASLGNSGSISIGTGASTVGKAGSIRMSVGSGITENGGPISVFAGQAMTVGGGGAPDGGRLEWLCGTKCQSGHNDATDNSVSSLEACQELCITNLGAQCRSVDYVNGSCYQSATCKNGNAGGGRVDGSSCTVGGEEDTIGSCDYCELQSKPVKSRLSAVWLQDLEVVRVAGPSLLRVASGQVSRAGTSPSPQALGTQRPAGLYQRERMTRAVME